MDPEDRKLLEETLHISKENNDILLKLKRSMQMRRVMSAIYWIFIIGSALGTYYFIEPYIGQLGKTYNEAKGDIENFNNIFDSLKTPR